jgi:hypothetical protein
MLLNIRHKIIKRKEATVKSCQLISLNYNNNQCQVKRSELVNLRLSMLKVQHTIQE